MLLGCLGFLLISGGPGLVIWWQLIASKSFLVLLTLTSAFAWLLALLGIASVFRVFLPLPENVYAYGLALTVAVAAEEVARYGVWLGHRHMVAALRSLGRAQGGLTMSLGDCRLLALTHGCGHALAHSTFFYLSWVPLAAGSATLYLDVCPQMSFFLAGALLSLAFFLIHMFSMVTAFEALELRDKRKWATVPILHLLASLLTLGNLARGGCMVTLPLLFALAAASVALAGWSTLKRWPADAQETEQVA